MSSNVLYWRVLPRLLCNWLLSVQAFLVDHFTKSYQKSVIGGTAGSSVPTLWRIAHALANSDRATEVQQLKVIQHVIRQIPRSLVKTSDDLANKLANWTDNVYRASRRCS